MKKVNFPLAALFLMLYFFNSCKEEMTAPVPIAPILKEIRMPEESKTIPGKDVVITGKGFSKSDIVYLKSLLGSIIKVTVKQVTDQKIVIELPKDIEGGSYNVIIERNGLQSILPELLQIPFLVIIDDLKMPSEDVVANTTINIEGKGFLAGDVLLLTSESYPDGVSFKITNVSVSENGITFKVPIGCYGLNEVTIERGLKKGILGNIKIPVSIGDVLGGGVVYYVDETQLHGLICKKENTGTATEQFGPAVAQNLSASTSKTLGSGKENTTKLISKLAIIVEQFPEWKTKKTAAQMCDDEILIEDEITYNDWFLPSQEELIELFKVKNIMATKGAGLPPNNYWTSSEGDGDAAGWSAYYVNFYEATNIVSGNSDKAVWKIGIRAIRSF